MSHNFIGFYKRGPLCRLLSLRQPESDFDATCTKRSAEGDLIIIIVIVAVLSEWG